MGQARLSDILACFQNGHNSFAARSLEMLLKNCDYDVVKSYQTPFPLWYPESFTRKFPRLGSMLKLNPLSMLLFAPLVGLGYVSGNSDNITIIARHCREMGQ
jgi:hypothetical protein